MSYEDIKEILREMLEEACEKDELLEVRELDFN